MKKVQQLVLNVFLISTLILVSVASQAMTITDSFLFESSNQSMWSEGNIAEWDAESFLGVRWGTYAGGSAIDKSIGIDVYAASVRAGIKSSGELGIVAWAKASGGGVSVSLPTTATITIPDTVSQNTYFKVSTSASIDQTARIDTQSPSFNAGIDGLFNMNNKLYGEAATFAGCGFWGTKPCETSGSVDVSLNPGRFSLLEFDTTKDDPMSIFGVNVPIGFDLQYDIHVPPGGAYPFIYNGTTGETTKPLTPIVGDIQIHRLEDKSGGTFSDDQLSLVTNQDIFKGSLSITGVLETLIGSPGVLRNDIMVYENSIKDIKAGYVLADVSIGPIFGMQQNFDLNPNLSVRLEFDQPITRLEWIKVGSHTETRDIFKEICIFSLGCFNVKVGQETVIVDDYEWVPVTHGDGFIDILLGGEADLMFDNGFANLLSIEYLMSDPTFRNQTYATIDPFLDIDALCASFTGLGRECVYEETYRTTGLAEIEVYSNQWVMGGFDSFTVDMRGNGPSEATAPIPEPATILLLGSGLAGLALYRRKRK